MPKDIVSKYYDICEVFDDDVERVAFCLKVEGAPQRPSFISKDIEYLWLEKYSEQIDSLFEMINDERKELLIKFATFAKYTGKKYRFDPVREAKAQGTDISYLTSKSSV